MVRALLKLDKAINENEKVNKVHSKDSIDQEGFSIVISLVRIPDMVELLQSTSRAYKGDKLK